MRQHYNIIGELYSVLPSILGLSDSIDSAIYRDSKLLSTSGYFTK